MRKIACFVLLLLVSGLSAQISVLPADSATQSEGFTYALPKTKLLIEITTLKTIQKAGPYFRYCERYLGITDMITEDKESYEVTTVHIRTTNIPDAKKTYKILVDKKGQLPTIALTKNGIIKGINAPEEMQPTLPKPDKKHPHKTPSLAFTNSGLTEDMVLANSTAKMAEGIAKQIYRIRENRLSLMTADVDHMPADGKSVELMLANMNKTEKELMELFVGKTVKISTKQVVEYIPEGTVSNYVVARLSTLKGLLPSEDLSGSPLYLNVTAEKKELKMPERSKKNPTYGFFYNLPGSAQVEITDGKTVLAEKQVSVAQFGSVQALPSSIFKNPSLKIKFNTHTGAIESIEK